jgi:hypothetical protein
MENGLYKINSGNTQETDNRGSRLVYNLSFRNENRCSINVATFKMVLDYHSRKVSDSTRIVKSVAHRASTTIK